MSISYSIRQYVPEHCYAVRIALNPENEILFSFDEGREVYSPFAGGRSAELMHRGFLLEVARVDPEVNAASLQQWFVNHQRDLEEILIGYLGRSFGEGIRGHWTDRSIVMAANMAADVLEAVNTGDIARHWKPEK